MYDVLTFIIASLITVIIVAIFPGITIINAYANMPYV